MTSIPDVLKVSNSGYNLLMENEKVRVMDMKLEAGEKSPMHNHPHDHVVYVFNDVKLKLSFPDGNSDNFDLKAGQILWIEAGSHETENIGTTKAHNLVTEVK